MGKTPKLKKGGKAPSLHSRSSRKRPPSPLSTSKSLNDPPPPSILSTHHHHHYNNTSKITKRAPSRQQRLRQERLREKAHTVRDVRAVKMEKSRGKGRVKGVKWEELNANIEGKKIKLRSDGRGKGKGKEQSEEWEDEDMNLEEPGVEKSPKDGLVDEPGVDGGKNAEVGLVVDPPGQPEEDEIL